MTGKELTEKEKLFVMHYVGVARFNGAEAARRAGYSEKSAKEIASQNLTKLHLREAIDKELHRFAANHLDLRKEIMAEYIKLAFSSPTNALEFDGSMIKLKNDGDLPPEVLSSIKSVKSTNNGVTVEFHDKKEALDSLAKALGMFSDNPIIPGEHYETMIERLEREERERKKNN